jgi:hypothetical protein
MGVIASELAWNAVLSSLEPAVETSAARPRARDRARKERCHLAARVTCDRGRVVVAVVRRHVPRSPPYSDRTLACAPMAASKSQQLIETCTSNRITTITMLPSASVTPSHRSTASQRQRA